MSQVLPPDPATSSRREPTPPSNLGDRVRSLRLAEIPAGQSYGRTILAWLLGLGIVAGCSALYIFTIANKNDKTASPEGPKSSSPSTNANTAASSTGNSSSSAGSTSVVSSGSSPAPIPTGNTALESKGYIIPAHQILVSPKVGGMIMKLNVEEGRRVQKGDVLAELESTDYEADMAKAKATVRLAREKLRELENGNRPEEIDQADAELAEAQAQLVQAKSQFKRDSDLHKRGAELVSEKDLDESEGKYKALQKKVDRLAHAFGLMKIGPREERLAIAQAEMDQAKADLDKAEWRFGNCTIRAPISGTILKKNAEEGNMVNAGAFQGSYSVCDIADLSDLEVDMTIQERNISAIFVGQKCLVFVEAYPKRLYEGYVARLMPIADRAKGAIPVRVKVKVPAEEEGIYLKPEMGAIVRFLKGDEKGAEAVTTLKPKTNDTPDNNTPAPATISPATEPSSATP